MTIEARGANKLAIYIKGISKANLCEVSQPGHLLPDQTSHVVKNLASPLNLGSKFNFKFVLTPQLVEIDKKTGLKHNQYKIQGWRGQTVLKTLSSIIHQTICQV